MEPEHFLAEVPCVIQPKFLLLFKNNSPYHAPSKTVAELPMVRAQGLGPERPEFRACPYSFAAVESRANYFSNFSFLICKDTLRTEPIYLGYCVNWKVGIPHKMLGTIRNAH